MTFPSTPAARLLSFALLLAVLGPTAAPAGQMPEGTRLAATDLPITNSFSGYIIAVG